MSEVPWWMWMGAGFGCGVGFTVLLILALGKWASTRPYMPGPFSREGLK
jgi:hypothetical protein